MKHLKIMIIVSIVGMLEAKAHESKLMNCFSMDSAIVYKLNLKNYDAYRGNATVAYRSGAEEMVGTWYEIKVSDGSRIHEYTQVTIEVESLLRDRGPRLPKEELRLKLLLEPKIEGNTSTASGSYMFISRQGIETITKGLLKCTYK